jgi:hypothetical protein
MSTPDRGSQQLQSNFPLVVLDVPGAGDRQ